MLIRVLIVNIFSIFTFLEGKCIRQTYPTSTSESGVSSQDEKIVHGSEIGLASIPYQSFITFTSKTNSHKWVCGAVLISTKYLITAGHCAFDAGSAQIVFCAENAHNPDRNAIKMVSTSIHVHEEYNSSQFFNDISIVELPENPIRLAMGTSCTIKVVQLPHWSDRNRTYVCEIMRISGWGSTIENQNTAYPKVLQYTENYVMPNELCKQYMNQLQDSEICMCGSEGKSSCLGDSGGPATVSGVLVGIVSYGQKGCVFGEPSVFTRITSHLKWIQTYTDVVIED